MEMGALEGNGTRIARVLKYRTILSRDEVGIMAIFPQL